MNPLAIISLLATLASIGTSIAKSAQEEDYQKGLEEHNKEQQRITKEEVAKRNKERKRDALGRAVGSGFTLMPTEEKVRALPPIKPDMTAYNVLGGVAQGVNSLAGTFSGGSNQAGPVLSTTPSNEVTGYDSIYSPYRYGTANA